MTSFKVLNDNQWVQIKQQIENIIGLTTRKSLLYVYHNTEGHDMCQF